MVVRLNIQFEITYSTTVIEFNTTMALVVLMERCNFVSADTEAIDSTEATGHFTLYTIYQGVPHFILLKRASWSRGLEATTVKLIIEGSRPTDFLSKGTYLLNIFFTSQFIRKLQN
jgi:hypothetical protein